MTLDSESIQRLKELGRKLPKKIETSNGPLNSKPIEKQKKHKIETEENPDALFHSLMEVSPDGSIPSHLINRLKQLETKESIKQDKSLRQVSGQSNKSAKTTSQKKPLNESKQNDDLYLTFKNLLLEEET